MLVNTVRGPLEPSELGLTLAHEHLVTSHETIMLQFPHLHDEGRVIAEVVKHVAQARALGLRTLCDATAPGLGRDVRRAAIIAARTGVNIIPATGYYTFDELPSYFASRSADEMAATFVYEAQHGIQGTAIKPGFLKCVTDAPGVTRSVEKVLRAVARAHRQTGLPISTHTLAAQCSGATQLDIFVDEGVDLAHVLVGHCGDTDDLDYLEGLSRRGAYLGMDRFGTADRLPYKRRLEVVAELCARGHGERLLLSQDHSIVRDHQYSADILAQRKDWSTTFVLSDVLRDLEASALSHDSVQRMVRANAHAWLSPTTAY